jgi:hypothetical protein
MASYYNITNLFLCFYRWDEHHKVEFYSEQVEIIFSSIYDSVNQLGEKASLVQDRSVTKHLVEIVSIVYRLVGSIFYSFFFSALSL